MEQVNDLLDMIGDKLAGMTKSNLVAGSPIALGKVTIVPLSLVSVGFGGAGGESDASRKHRRDKGGHSHDRGKGSGEGSGGGGQVRPVAVAAFTEDGVDVLTIRGEQSLLDKILAKLPDLIDRVSAS